MNQLDVWPTLRSALPFGSARKVLANVLAPWDFHHRPQMESNDDLCGFNAAIEMLMFRLTLRMINRD